MFKLTILGTNAALPSSDAITSAQVLHCQQNAYLIDCGEGTQMKMHKWHIRRNKINAIFISHLHGDHLFGLPGLLTSYAHFQRTEKLIIIGPQGIKAFVETVIKLSEAYIGFELLFTEITAFESCTIYEDQYITVDAIPLKHRIPTYGYVFREKEKYNLKADWAASLKLQFDQIKLLKSGQDIVVGDKIYKSSECTYVKNKGKSYAYCSDTIYDPTIVNYIQGVDVVYHESTYLDDLQVQAKERMHSTAKEAAMIAKMAGVGQLILGHFSTRYNSLLPFLEEAKHIFDAVIIAEEGMEIEIGNKI